MINYFYDCYRILNKVYSEGSFLKQAIATTDIEEKNKNMTIKTCYGVLDNDIRLSWYLTKLADKSPKLAIRTILKIAMYDIEFLEKHDYAIIDNAVELTKKLGKGGTAGFVNAFLRRFAKEIPKIPDNGISHLSLKYSYPEFAVKRLIGDYGTEKAEKIMSAVGGTTYVRFKQGVDGEKYLQDNLVIYDKTSFENLFACTKFVRNDGYDKGLYTFQAIGSVAICDCVEGGEKLLDACAAPGGKTVLLAERFSEVTACDIYEHRLELIKSYAKRMDMNNITVKNMDGAVFNPDFKEAFDAVLCDVPCSGYGVVKDNPDIKLNGKEKDISELSALQLKILSNCAKYVKKGGCLYYSTCSIFVKENIENIKAFMSDNKAFELVKLTSPVKHLDYDGTLQFLPDEADGGFYIAKLKRTD